MTIPFFQIKFHAEGRNKATSKIIKGNKTTEGSTVFQPLCPSHPSDAPFVWNGTRCLTIAWTRFKGTKSWRLKWIKAKRTVIFSKFPVLIDTNPIGFSDQILRWSTKIDKLGWCFRIGRHEENILRFDVPMNNAPIMAIPGKNTIANHAASNNAAETFCVSSLKPSQFGRCFISVWEIGVTVFHEMNRKHSNTQIIGVTRLKDDFLKDASWIELHPTLSIQHSPSSQVGTWQHETTVG